MDHHMPHITGTATSENENKNTKNDETREKEDAR
jgi:hypothetical protein